MFTSQDFQKTTSTKVKAKFYFFIIGFGFIEGIGFSGITGFGGIDGGLGETVSLGAFKGG